MGKEKWERKNGKEIESLVKLADRVNRGISYSRKRESQSRKETLNKNFVEDRKRMCRAPDTVEKGGGHQKICFDDFEPKLYHKILENGKR